MLVFSNVFYEPLPDVRNLTRRPAIAKKLFSYMALSIIFSYIALAIIFSYMALSIIFHTWPSPLFLLYTQEMLQKNCSVNKH